MSIYTFWEGELPDYIKLCLETWKFDYVILDYTNLNKYTDLDINKISRYTLPQISDIVRVHVLRDQGGFWMDADTIMIGDKLPKTNMVGIPKTRNAHCGYLNFIKGHPMLIDWAKEQDRKINLGGFADWDAFANSFSDGYIKEHKGITIASRKNKFPESYLIEGEDNKQKYISFYFEKHFSLSDIKPTEMLMLHNSWTPSWYKALSEEEVFSNDCTMSNILREVLK